MVRVSFQVVDGVDKGRCFIDLDPPITIGREEGNAIRLNDDRVSRFHVKIQEDQGQLVLTDLDSTNGTRVNGETVQLRLLRIGDRISVGRTTLVYGTLEQISDLYSGEEEDEASDTQPRDEDEEVGFQTNPSHGEFDFGDSERIDVFSEDPPDLPHRLTPAQAAQLSEVVDYLHRGLADASNSVHIPLAGNEARLTLSSWQRIQAVLSILADYSRQISEPKSREEDDE